MNRGRVPRGASVWLALLVLGLVFAATAGVRESLATRTEALRQTVAGAPVLSSTIAVDGTWQTITDALTSSYQQTPALLSTTDATAIGGQLRGDLNQGAVRLAPAAADWTALTSRLNTLTVTPAATQGTPVEVEVTSRQPLNQYVRLLSGAFPAAPEPAPASQELESNLAFYPVIPVLASQQTAAKFGWKAGSRVQVPGPLQARSGQATTITLVVSGIVAAVTPAAAFWTSDPAAITPTLQAPPRGPPVWVGGVLVGPAGSAAVQSDFGVAGVNVQWLLPLAVDELTGDQAQPLNDALSGLGSTALPLSDQYSDVSDTLAVSTGLPSVLTPFVSAAQSADVLLWLLYVSLTAAGLVVLLLAGRMVVLRRSAELTLIRARGASLGRIGLSVGGEAALVCVPAAAVAVTLAVLAVPAAGGLQPAGAAGTWWAVAAVLLVAVAGPAALAIGRNRLPRRRRQHNQPGRRQPRARVRLVAEVTLVAAAAGGILIFRQQGLAAGASVNLLTSAVPVLIAVPVVIVVFRLYPLVLRWLLRAAARTAGAPAFLGLARAARTALTPALPAFALVLTLTVAAFGGMLRDAVAGGQAAASWQAAGADATITPSPVASSFTIPAAAARAIAAVPGVTHAAQVYRADWFTPGGTEVIVLAVDPAAYATLVAATQGYPGVPAGQLARPASAGAPQPALASPSAAAALGRDPVTLSTTEAAVVKIRIAGTLAATPAQPPTAEQPDPAFVILPLTAVRPAAVDPVPIVANELLLTGSGINQARLTTLVRQRLPGGNITLRSAVLAGLSGAPLQHGAVTVITLSIVAAAVLGLAVMLLELALGVAERDATLARLATMGLGEGQRARVVALELLPAVITAGLAAWACALALPPVVRPVIDLSVFTGSAAAVPLVPDAAAVALPLAGLVVLAAVALAIEIGAGRRRGAASALKVGG